MFGTLLCLHSSTSHRNTNLSNKAILAVLSRVGRNRVCHLFVTNPPRGLTAVVIVIGTAQIHQRLMYDQPGRSVKTRIDSDRALIAAVTVASFLSAIEGQINTL